MTHAKNPYVVEDGTAKLLESIIVLADILGYTEMIRVAKDKGLEKEALNEFRKSINEPYKNLSFAKEGLHGENIYEVKTYSDNIIIGYPIYRDGELEFGSIVENMTMFQLSLALSGLFIRGALAAGDIFIDEHIVFGSGLITVYNAEKYIAKYPRVVLTDSASIYLKKHLQYYGDARLSPQHSDLLKCEDGSIFINYLNILFVSGFDSPYEEELMRHKNVLEIKLEAVKEDLNTIDKYIWVASYHNYFCDLHAYYFDERYKISIPQSGYKFSTIEDI